MDVVVFVVNGAEEVAVSAARVTKTHEQEQGQGLRPVGRSNDCVDFECQWIPGHPERRDSDKSRWSYKDTGSRLLIHACMPSYPISKPDYPTFKTRWLVQYTSFSHTFDMHVDVIMS